MNLAKLKEIQKEISRKVDINSVSYENRKIVYEKYIKDLDLFLKNNSDNAWGMTQKIMAENFASINDSHPEDLLNKFLEEHYKTLTLEDKALIVNNTAYYEFENKNFKKVTILRLEIIANRGIKTKSVLYPLVFAYVNKGSSKTLLYMDDLKSIMGNTLELLLWEALGYRFLGKIDKSCELLEAMLVKINNEIKKDSENVNSYLLMYSELVRYNLCYNKYLQKDFDYAYKELSILEKEIDNNLAVEIMYDNVFDLYCLMDCYEDVKRVGKKMIGSYSNKGFFEHYLYAIYKTDGIEVAKNKMENYLKEATENMSTEIKDDLELNENTFECTESLLDEMLFITTAYNNMINNDTKPEVNEKNLLLHFWAEECFLENCIVHNN